MSRLLQFIYVPYPQPGCSRQSFSLSLSFFFLFLLSLCVWKIPARLTKQSVQNCTYFRMGVWRINGHRLRFSVAKDQRLSPFSVDTTEDECRVLFAYIYIYKRTHACPRARALRHACTNTHTHTHTTTIYPIHPPLSLSLSHPRNFQGTIHVPPW